MKLGNLNFSKFSAAGTTPDSSNFWPFNNSLNLSWEINQLWLHCTKSLASILSNNLGDAASRHQYNQNESEFIFS